MSHLAEPDTLPPSQDPRAVETTVEPPREALGIIKQLGPGLIIAGSIVGSGELIATTKAGAQAGIALLWLILLGCLIKVFVQIELGRYTISHGETTLTALNRVPGPYLTFWKNRHGGRFGANWIVWCWLAMMLAGIGQLGGIVGGVGQALALTVPIRGDYVEAIRVPSESELKDFVKWEDDLTGSRALFSQLTPDQQERLLRGHEIMRDQIEQLGSRGQRLLARVRRGESLPDPWTFDDRIWAAVVAVITAGLLYVGRYRFIQNFTTVLVVSFTLITIGNVVSLQMTEQWHLSREDFLHGLSFSLPQPIGDIDPLMTALAAFGIIGVGASELFAYPYWCLEKGYARFTGPNRPGPGWGERARGWIRVMHYDAFLSMVVYTVATLAFFTMGVAVLYSEGRDPEEMRMVSTLAQAYVPVFGDYARWLFLSGAIAVLYSTFLVSNAGNARMYTDACKLYGLIDPDSQPSHERTLSVFCVVLPLLCLAVYATGVDPVGAILFAGFMQAMLLPMIAVGTLYLRYARTDERLRPRWWWDVLLFLSAAGLLIAGAWGVYNKLF